jgi:hypothetical protein
MVRVSAMTRNVNNVTEMPAFIDQKSGASIGLKLIENALRTYRQCDSGSTILLNPVPTCSRFPGVVATDG